MFTEQKVIDSACNAVQMAISDADNGMGCHWLKDLVKVLDRQSKDETFSRRNRGILDSERRRALRALALYDC